MVSFIIGRAGSGKTHHVISQIKEAEGEIILLVPEQYSHATERMLCEIAGDEISCKAEVLSFKRLCDRIFMFAGGYANKALDNGGRMLLMHRAITRVRRELKVLSNMALRPEFLQGLIDMVEEIKTCSVSYERLFDTGTGVLSDKLHDIAVIAAAYDGEFENGKLDPADRLNLATERARESGFFEGKKIWIDGYNGFSQQELELLRVALAQCDECTVSLCLNDDPDGENGAFSDAWNTYSAISRMAGDSKTLRLDAGVRYKRASLAYLEKNLYNVASGIDDHDGIELYTAGNAYNECEIAAAKIIELVQGGMRFRDIAVTARNFEEYANVLTSVFRRYNIPVYENTKQTVQALSPTAFILNALRVISDGFKYDDMVSYLKTGLTGVRRANLDILEQYLYTWHVEGREWTSGEDFTKNPSGRNETPKDGDIETLAFLNRLRKKVCTPLLNLRTNIRGESTGKGYAKALFSFFGETKLARRLEARAKLYRMRGDIYRAEQYEKIWHLLINAIENIADTLGEEHFKIDEFIRVFSLVLSQCEIGTIPTALDRVNLVGFDRLGEAPVKCVITLGTIDGRLPMYSAGKGILSDSEREKLISLGIKLSRNAENRLNEEFRLIYDAFTTASEKLIVVIPHTAPDGSEARDSFVIKRIMSLFPNIKKEKFEMPELYAKAPCFDMAVSSGDGPWQVSAKEYFTHDAEYGEKSEIAEKNANVPRGPLKHRENIEVLFGKRIRLSASKSDCFNSCRYQYFLRYGLYLNPKRRATFDSLETGTFTHAVLEYVLKEIKERGGHRAVEISEVLEISDMATDTYIEEKLGGFRGRTARFRAQIKRLRESVRKIVLNVHKELRDSVFEPVDFELHFADKDGDLPALTINGDNYTVKLEGYVDRVDACSVDNAFYVRVVDYKTGSKEFDLKEVLNGLNMQMLLYLFTLCDLGEGRYNRKPIAAGVLYLPANAPMCKVEGAVNEADVAAMNDASVQRKGLLLKKQELYTTEKYLPVSYDKNGELKGKSFVDAEDFEKISRRIKSILETMGDELTRGMIDANPYYTSQRTPCDYCEMKSICHFGDGLQDEFRDLFAVGLEDC